MIEWYRFVILLVIPYVLFGIAFVLNYLDTQHWKIRKFIHSVGLFVAALYGTFVDTLFDLFGLIFVFIATLLVLSIPPIKIIQRLIIMGTREGEREWIVFINVFLTSLNVVLLRLVFVEERWIFLAAVLSVSLGDTLGEFVGRPYGNHQYRIFSQKSIEGSFGVLIGTIIGGMFALIMFQLLSGPTITIVLLASVIATLIEGSSPLFLDNIMMPLAYSGVLWYYLVA